MEVIFWGECRYSAYHSLPSGPQRYTCLTCKMQSSYLRSPKSQPIPLEKLVDDRARSPVPKPFCLLGKCTGCHFVLTWGRGVCGSLTDLHELFKLYNVNL